MALGSKNLILLGLCAAFVFLMITSQVTAAYFAQTTSKNGGGHYHGGGGSGSDSYNGIGSAQSNINPSCSVHGGGSHAGRGGGEGGGGGRGRCIHCCGFRCCSEAEAQALEATQVKPQN